MGAEAAVALDLEPGQDIIYGPSGGYSGLSRDELVGLGCQEVARSRWTLGDLAREVVTRYGEGKLRAYVEDVGVAYSTLRRYRDVAQAFPAESAPRGAHSWSVYRELAAQPDRLELVSGKAMTVAEARTLAAGQGSEAPETNADQGKEDAAPVDAPPSGDGQAGSLDEHAEAASSDVQTPAVEDQTPAVEDQEQQPDPEPGAAVTCAGCAERDGQLAEWKAQAAEWYRGIVAEKKELENRIADLEQRLRLATQAARLDRGQQASAWDEFDPMNIPG